MTHQQTSERFEKAHCLVKNAVGLQEAENGALLCSMEIANKPRRSILKSGKFGKLALIIPFTGPLVELRPHSPWAVWGRALY